MATDYVVICTVALGLPVWFGCMHCILRFRRALRAARHAHLLERTSSRALARQWGLRTILICGLFVLIILSGMMVAGAVDAYK